jgi:hypothetical protein
MSFKKISNIVTVLVHLTPTNTSKSRLKDVVK